MGSGEAAYDAADDNALAPSLFVSFYTEEVDTAARYLLWVGVPVGYLLLSLCCCCCFCCCTIPPDREAKSNRLDEMDLADLADAVPDDKVRPATPRQGAVNHARPQLCREGSVSAPVRDPRAKGRGSTRARLWPSGGAAPNGAGGARGGERGDGALQGQKGRATRDARAPAAHRGGDGRCDARVRRGMACSSGRVRVKYRESAGVNSVTTTLRV